MVFRLAREPIQAIYLVARNRAFLFNALFGLQDSGRSWALVAGVALETLAELLVRGPCVGPLFLSRRQVLTFFVIDAILTGRRGSVFRAVVDFYLQRGLHFVDLATSYARLTSCIKRTVRSQLGIWLLRRWKKRCLLAIRRRSLSLGCSVVEVVDYVGDIGHFLLAQCCAGLFRLAADWRSFVPCGGVEAALLLAGWLGQLRPAWLCVACVDEQLGRSGGTRGSLRWLGDIQMPPEGRCSLPLGLLLLNRFRRILSLQGRIVRLPFVVTAQISRGQLRRWLTLTIVALGLAREP